MATYVVAYDLIGTDATTQNYKRLDEAIEAIGEAREIQRSVWIVVANRRADQIFRRPLAIPGGGRPTASSPRGRSGHGARSTRRLGRNGPPTAARLARLAATLPAMDR